MRHFAGRLGADRWGASAALWIVGCVVCGACSDADPHADDAGTSVANGSATGGAGASPTTHTGGAGGSQAGTGGRGAAGGASGSGGRGGGNGGSPDVRDAGAPDAAAADAGVQQPLSWPNQDSQANSDPWLAEHNTEITELHPRVLVLNFANRIAPDKMQSLADEHIAAWKEASRYHGYSDAAATPFVTYEIAKIVDLRDGTNAVNSNKLPVSGSGVDYGALNSAQFAALIGIEDPDKPGTPLTLCQLFEKGLIHEVWGSVADGGGPKFAESAETKQVYDEQGHKLPGEFRSVSNGPDISDAIPCSVSTRIYDFNPTRGAGCHLHAAGHAWENYIRRGAVPQLKQAGERFLNVDFKTRFPGSPIGSFYDACGGGTTTNDCVIWDSQIHARSGPGSSAKFDFADMSGGCGNAHFYPNTVGNYSYELATKDPNNPDDPEVLTSCENYGLQNGDGGRDQTSPFSNAMTFALYDGNASVNGDCGGRGTTYIYQSFPGRGNSAKNDDGSAMQNWWVYLFY